jgi:hypothetical protein
LIDYGVIENPNIRGKQREVPLDRPDGLAVCSRISRTNLTTGKWKFISWDSILLWNIYLNGAKIGTHNDVYLPQSIDISGRLCRRTSWFSISARPIESSLKSLSPRNCEGRVKNQPRPGFSILPMEDYLGPKPRLVRMGVYDEIFLEERDKTKISWMGTSDTRLDDSLSVQPYLSS